MPDEQESTPGQRQSKWKWLLYLGVAIALIVAARYFGLQEWLKQVVEWIGGLGAWGVVLFIAVYVVATVLFIPGSVLTLGAGAVFGVVWGSVYVSIGSTLGATCAFLVGRHLARDAIARKLEGKEQFAAIDRAVEREGWTIVGLTRLSPVFPFTLLNYAYGLTRVKLWHYVLASWIGMMPGTVMYVYLGSVAKAVSGEKTTGEWVLYGVGLVATIVVTLYVTHLARKALGKRIED
ncbi:MAG: TVP38/TMEM64 family protein [Verrucomicrobia bacterium]|nr:TVP38/TMEM64 family protein [Verrucomicrobiota bacterium]